MTIKTLKEVKEQLKEREEEYKSNRFTRYIDALMAALQTNGISPDDFHIGNYSRMMGLDQWMRKTRDYLISVKTCPECYHGLDDNNVCANCTWGEAFEVAWRDHEW